MSLFQKSVLNKYIKGLSSLKIDKAWQKFTAHFHHPQIQDNIRNSKEEQYQGEFLIDLFVNVLGYVKNPTPNFNLTTELKNIKGSKKTDGAILKGDQALAVIELKGTNTTDLSKIEEQAFGYKNNHPGCIYVITANFEKLRFYIDNAVDFEEFNLFQLTKNEFEILWLCLAADNLLKNIPKQIKNESLAQEETVTKKLYHDYSQFRHEIFINIQKNNSQYDKLTLFKKTQKLLDRFLFILFAEDRLLLPPNAIRQIVKQWTTLRDELDAYVPLYERFQKYFGYLNEGYKGKTHDIFAYNGGLFFPDPILDTIKIDDDILYKHTLNLSNYDFESEVSVNILGHIFEHSLNEIEEIQADLSGIPVDKTKNKRKKDGIFYTPKYITKYIVEQTVGRLCTEKKTELDIQEEDYEKDRKGRKKTVVITLNQKLEKYRNWLLKLTICDPACGSGAFLNQALEFLIAEHRYIDELKAKLYGDAMVLSEVENTILENNLFGVDINEESVEIAKLSLWLRTAQKGRKLTSLNDNIKCGNSLIDDPQIAAEKAFDWHKEFPTIFNRKEKRAFHITTVTHDSCTSQRMIDYKVREKRDHGLRPEAESIWLEPEDELFITGIVARIVKEDNLNVLAYNICGDHIHLLLVCEEQEINKIVGKIKAVTSKEYNIKRGITTRGHVPLSATGKSKKKKKYNSLWAQKFGRKEIRDDNQLWYTIEYIKHNRKKHNLPPLYDEDCNNNPDKGTCPLVNEIDSFCCTYEHAFRTEYKGGFDVVIGNPPYLRIQGLKDAYPELTTFYEKYYTSATGNYDIYVLFLEKAYQLINENGVSSYIMPHKFLIADFGVGIRKFLKKYTAAEQLIHFGSEIVFQEAATYTCIINLSKSKKKKLIFKKIKPDQLFDHPEFDYMNYDKLSEENWDLQSEKIYHLIEKLKKQPYTVSDVFDKIFVGLQTSLDAVYVFRGEDRGSYIKGYNEKYDYHFEIEKEMVKPILGGRDIHRYKTPPIINYVVFPYQLKNNIAEPMDENFIKEKFPKAYNYLKRFEKKIRDRERGRFDNKKKWFLFGRSQGISQVEFPKIMTREISLGCNMTYDETGRYYHNTKVYSFVKNEAFVIDDKFYLSILNSKLMWFFIKNTSSGYRGGYYVFTTSYLKPFPLPAISNNASEIIKKVNKQLSDNKELQVIIDAFLQLIQSKFNLDKLSKKLQNWHELDFGEFLKELKKNKVKLGLKEEAEWLAYFNDQKNQAQALKTEIEQTDNKMDQMVYELYGLTDDEIRIVEASMED